MTQKPETSVYAMSDAALEEAIRIAEQSEVALRNHLAELRLHRMMRRHVQRQHIKESIAKLQRLLEAEETAA